MAQPNINYFLEHKINSDAYDYLKYLIGRSYVDKLIDFLNPESLNKTVTPSQLHQFFNDLILPATVTTESVDYTPKDSLNLSESDKFSVFAANIGIRYWLTGTRQPLLELTDSLLQRYRPGIDAETAREDFFFYKAFLYNAFLTEYATVVPAAEALYNRLKIWKKNYNPSKTKEENLKQLNAAELSWLNDQLTLGSNDSGGNAIDALNYLEEVFQKVYDTDWQTKFNTLKTNASPNQDISTVDWTSFYRAFKPISGNEPVIDPKSGAVDADQLERIFQRIQESGLLLLASYASDIAAFGKKRLSSSASVQKSAFDYFNATNDQAWLDQLIFTVQKISRDPITLSMVNIYFPSLVTFFFDALAVTGDYSNDGLGGGEEDTVNNMQDFLKSLQTALGAKNGQDVFSLVFYGPNDPKNFKNTAERIKEVLQKSPYRANISPQSPDIFHFRLGAANFYVPPLSININTAFKTGSLTGGALRQKNSPKFNSGYKETSISIRLFFPNYEEIWGISIEDASRIQLKDNFVIDFSSNGDSDKKIDKFLSSLRGMVAAFKYSPFLPVKNSYLNSVHGITAVALSNMQVQTVPNFPFALAVDIELLNFNHKPLLPMITDFNQAIHWGKYRQYMGKAAGSLSNYVNGEFLQKQTDVKGADQKEPFASTVPNSSGSLEKSYGINTVDLNESQLATNIYSEWTNGNNISFYIPVESQTKIFLPDMSSIRQNNEELMSDQNEDFWARILNYFGININSASDYGVSLANTYNLAINGQYNRNIRSILRDSIDILVAGNSDGEIKEKVYAYLVKVFKIENKGLSSAERKYIEDINNNEVPAGIGPSTYIVNGETLTSVTLPAVKEYIKKIALSSKAYLDHTTSTLVNKKAKEQKITIPADGELGSEAYQNLKKQIKDQVSDAFNVLVYERFYSSGPIQALMEAIRAKSGSFQFREWEVPMMKVDLDPASVTVTGVSVSLGNNLAKLQLQMQDEPTYQHIGGKDSYVNISMTVVGEKELAKIKKIFDHVNALARLEHASGVLGFMGIKNIITALCGIKYVMPSNYSVSTVPDYPHVYQVNITLMDFDVFQQTREKLSSVQQKDFIDNFSSKRNPFLRIKQMWGAFNAYPDLPLEVKDSNNETVGTLDPDFYFRSFDMFDKDIVYNISNQVKPITFGTTDEVVSESQQVAKAYQYLPQFVREYSGLNQNEKAIKLRSLTNWLKENGIDYKIFLKAFESWIKYPYDPSGGTEIAKETSSQVLTDYIDFIEKQEPEIVNKIFSAPYQVGNLSSSSIETYKEIELALSGEYSLPNEEDISFIPEELSAHANIYMLPIKDPNDPNKIPAMLVTAYGTNFGYIDTEKSGRFYLTIDGVKVQKNSKVYELAPIPIDEQTNPALGTTRPAVAGMAPLSDYGSPISHGDQNVPEWSSGKSEPPKTVNMHWEKMLVDTQYRDVSGRMVRAFPTYMLWLIDEGGYFAGVKLFDNFYGLQSIVDFSVVSSEDLLGDTLIFRVSNLYSKLTKAASSDIFSADSPLGASVSSGIGSILDNTLNKARNILAHMKNDYVVNIENIVLKPGVRVHLRGGYGSNPNALQTLFNGTITQVEYGEVVTVTAQSDAIELGAVVNSTNKKGDSGKIDGGINTGLWLSEPRDLMVRLLSMGTSRFREGIANAYRGLVFSENKFGIRHFGAMLYEPLSEAEASKHYAMVDSIADAHRAASEMSGSAIGQSALNMVGVGVQEFRYPVASLMGQLWSNFSAQRDMEIFKRNIYPGNGTGIAQFLGGDLGDGWTSVASITPEDQPNPRLEYLSRLSDRSWNSLMSKYDSGDPNASAVIDEATKGGAVRDGQGSASLFRNLTLGGIGTTMAIAGGPIVGTVGVGVGLLGVLSGRGGNNIFRTLGLISANSDDDMPGFDEVSFRAQTYMRSVWDLFQTCARLLPNYIVSVRPFEDRSTIFYGKPHWLYTSGVVPITTGYPGDEKAAELGIIPPQINEPDFDLMQIMTDVNKSINPYADAEAFLRGTEPLEALNQLATLQKNAEGIFSTAGYLKSQKILINFMDKDFQEITDSNGNIIVKLPKSKGNVTMGFHLPVGTREQIVSDIRNTKHAQIQQLPSRFRFPFFTTRKNDENFLDTYSFQYGLAELGYNGTDKGSTHKNFILNKVEKIYGSEFKELFISDINYQDSQSISGSIAYEILNNPLDFSLNAEAFDKAANEQAIQVTMPTPEKNIASQSSSQILELSPELGGANPFTYLEWEPPKNDLEEQFYIAMRWPYKVNVSDDALVKKFKKYYFDNDQASLYGEAKDYQNMHVLVYNPSGNGGNGSAVVCKPAYFLWGENKTTNLSKESQNGTDVIQTLSTDIDAVVSPDAAFYLDILSYDVSVKKDTEKQDLYIYDKKGYAPIPDVEECYFAFVPNTIPLGVAFSAVVPIKNFKIKKSPNTSPQLQPFNPGPPGVETEDSVVIGFGNWVPTNGANDLYAVLKNPSMEPIRQYVPEGANNSSETDYRFGGNYKSYYSLIKKPIGDESRNNLQDITYGINLLKSESNDKDYSSSGRVEFASVFSNQDSTSVEARKFYDEDYDINTTVIAGNGRTLAQAQQIWDQFRYGYHTYDTVKDIFKNTYLMDWNDTTPFPEEIQNIFGGKPLPEKFGVYKKFGETGNNALDEFSLLFGDIKNSSQQEAIEFSRKNFVDAPIENGGLIEYFNALTAEKIALLKSNLFDVTQMRNIYGQEVEEPDLGSIIKCPQDLFYYLVGLFRQSLWSDAYARAWLVLKPDRKIDYLNNDPNRDVWSFKPIDKIFQAYIFPGNTYAKDKKKFLELLYKNKSEGNSTTNLASKTLNSLGDFYDKSVGQIFNAVTDSLSAMFNVFRLNMLQTGYGLSQSSVLARQANILNKALNDSIYYQLGRPGSLLRAVDNPFTREYAEPVVEIREPFQRIHYLSSFSHIISNQIQENSGVSTTITAVSDGKYPVTVSLDKGAPADRQVETTVETGIYFDNVVGSGFFGFLHPLLHPFETGRGVSKNVTGAPDELSAKRIALSHLRESVKDIYGGEIIIVGNPDIRPHDLVYLADIYERMYGMFEVEQVVHHFNSELGFVTSITPNALVTVNDPARWFMTSWLHSWLNVQTVRNDTRIYLDSLRAGNAGLTMGGEISLDALGNSLSPQLIGGMQFTGGSSALVKDVVANVTASGFTNSNLGDAIRQQAAKNGNNGQVDASAIAGVISGTAGLAVGIGTAGYGIASAGTAAIAGTAVGVGAAPVVAGAGLLLVPLVWKAWKWVRNNLLDQHGCYVQYLTRNGQPMEAGLSYNQGMVVGRYHSISLLPGILGVRTKTRSAEGYQYIRTNDLMKSLGWSEKDTSAFVRYASYENALVHAQVLGLSGLGPEKTGFEPFFKVLCTLSKGSGLNGSGVTDGDTIHVEDVLNPNVKFTVRLDGINVSEKIQIGFTETSKNGWIIGKNIKLIDNKYYATLVTGGYNYDDNDQIIKDSYGYPIPRAIENNLIPYKIVNNQLVAGDKVTIKNLGYPFDGTHNVLSAQVVDPNFNSNIVNYFTYELTPTQSSIDLYGPVSAFYDSNLQNTITPIDNKLIFNLDNEKQTRYSSEPITNDLVIEDFGSPGMLAAEFVKTVLENKTFVVRIKQSRTSPNKFETEQDFEPNGNDNRINYLKERYQRTLGTVFYNVPSDAIEKSKENVFVFMRNYKFDVNQIVLKFKEEFFDPKEPFYVNFSYVFSKAYELNNNFDWDNNEYTSRLLQGEPTGAERVRTFYALVEVLRLYNLYNNASKWPLILWDEYYEDGTPATLNWELVTRNYGTSVYTKDLLTESESVINSSEQLIKVE